MAVTATFGIFCEDEFYDGDDKMWELSQIFFYISSSLGGVAVVLAWAVTLVIPPTNTNWRVLSFLSAISAVLQVPIFLIFESGPCRLSDVQTCGLSTGSYYLIISTSMWIMVTLCTQFLDPPLWAVELSAWRIPKHPAHHQILLECDEESLGNQRLHSHRNVSAKRQATKQNNRSKLSNLSLPAVSTDSMKDDDFDLHSPSSDNSDSRIRISRVQDTKEPHNQSRTSYGDIDSKYISTDDGWMDNTPTMSSSRSASEEVTYFQPSIPSQATERIQVLPVDPKMTSLEPLSPKSPGGKSRSGSTISRKSRSKAEPAVPNGAMILADLQAQAAIIMPSSIFNENANEEYSDRVPLTSTSKDTSEKYSIGIRALTKKLNNDAKRRRSRRQRRRKGYEPMMDDDDSDDDSFMSPPIEVKIQPFANFDNIDFNQDFTDDENEDLMDDWNALHRATTAGVRMGLQEGYSQDGEKIDFDSPIQGYHSDPEPAYYSSDASRSKASLSELKVPGEPESQRHEDSSTLSGSSGSRARSNDSKKSRGRTGRKKRKQNSPNVSIVSGGSLLDVTIDEETDQDVMEEISVGEVGIQGILGAYKMERTFSEPLPRPTGYMQPRDDLETISLNASTLPSRRLGVQARHSPTFEFKRQLLSPSEPFARIPFDATLLPLPALTHPDVGSGIPRGEVPYSARSVSNVSSLKRYVEARSLSYSPRRGRTSQAEPRSNNSTAKEGEKHQNDRWLDDNGRSESPRSTRSNLSTRAREYRIRRMQRMKVASDQPTTDDSYIQDRRQASVQMGQCIVNETIFPSFSNTNRPSYEDNHGVYSNLQENLGSVQVEPDGIVPDRTISPEDFSDLKTDSMPKDLPKFTAKISNNISYSPTPDEANDELPELSPIVNDDSEKLFADADSNHDGKDFPTLTTAASDTPTLEDASSANYESEEVDEFPVDTEVGLLTGLAHNEDSSQEQYLADEDFDKYGTVDMDDLDLQLIAVRRPIGKEYGDDEVSL